MRTEPEDDPASTAPTAPTLVTDAPDQELQAARLAAILESLSDAVFTLDHDWRIIYVNAEGERLVRRRRQDLLGAVIWDEFPETVDSELYPAYHRAVVEGRPVTVERYWNEPLDTTFEITAYPADLGLVVHFRDVQEQLERERQLAARAEDEQRTATRLRELDDTKNAFLSAVSHELRSPLTVVRGLARELVERGDELGDDDRRAIEREILDQADRLERLLADLLDVDRLTRGALRTRQAPADVVEVVRTAVDLQPDVDRVTLESPQQLVATVDRSQLERIVANLVGNAAKYAPHGPITVRVQALDPGVRIDVLDEGPGIPEADRERVFEPLYRVDEDHRRPGTGIGLSLVAAFAELHGGGARVVPSDHGAHVRVDLPGATVGTIRPPADQEG